MQRFNHFITEQEYLQGEAEATATSLSWQVVLVPVKDSF